MEIIINNIEMPINHNTEDVFNAAQEFVRLVCVNRDNMYIYRQSLDARRKNNIHYVYSVVINTDDITGRKILNQNNPNIKELENIEELNFKCDKDFDNPPVVVGTGPCGLFAAFVLAKCGLKPIVLERGADVDKRAKKVDEFWDKGVFDKDTNVQFGEGGAGTFSDGKLTTRINDPLQRFVLKTFVDNNAPDDIMYKAKPHIGTDKLRDVVKNMRNEIIKMGGKVMFGTCLTDIYIKDDKICEIEVNNTDRMKCDNLILAIGHSSRDTYKMLYDRGVFIEPKPFAAGVRIEHKQDFINKMQYGKDYAKLNLPSADYKMVYNGKDRSCYSFCMCPGGTIVNASSEPNCLVVNGMSEYKRDKVNANSALVVTVRPDDFYDKSPLGGIEFQRKYERLAFCVAGGNYSAPIQYADDFLDDKVSKEFKEVLPSFTGKTIFADMRKCLPEFITDTLKEGLKVFESKNRGFTKTALLTGIEMRTSAPVRIKRDESRQSINIKGIYPTGEGAGYAGGIVSAAVDGIKTVLQLIK